MLENDHQQTVGTVPRPVATDERINEIDVLRGVAILGVLVAYTVWNLGNAPLETYGTVDKALSFVLGTLLNMKAYTILAFLFGLGFSIQLIRARERRENVVPIFTRRLITLMAIGVAHSLLLRNGDILVPYATIGFALLLFRNASNTTLVIGGAIGSALPFVARWLWEISGVPYPSQPATEGMGHFAANFEWAKYWYATAITLWPEILPMFLCGLYVGRKRVFENLSRHKKGLRRVLIIGLIGGTVIYAGRLVMLGMIELPESSTHPLIILLRFSWKVHTWGFAAFYAASILLLLQLRRVRDLSKPLGAVGRMSLTNYLLQSIIVVPICVVLGLYDTFTPQSGLLLALIVALIQIPFSVIWLKHFRFGPAEWLWRSLTYKKPQPMRLLGPASSTDRSALAVGSHAGS